MEKKRSASAIGRQSRAKGNQWERDCANLFKEAGWPEAKRELNQWRKSGGVDIIEVGDYVPQCMKSKAPNAFKKFAEAVSECKKPGQIPVALLRKESQTPGVEGVEVAVVPLKWFFDTIKYLKVMTVPESSSASTLIKEDKDAG